jgi:hypothetical protein
MVMVDFYDSEKEKSRHHSAVQRLAEDLGLPIIEIGTLYEGILKELRKSARIKDYLMILATREVKDRLRGGRGRGDSGRRE